MGQVKNQQILQAQLVGGTNPADKNQQQVRLALFTETGQPVDVAQSFYELATMIFQTSTQLNDALNALSAQVGDLTTRVEALENA